MQAETKNFLRWLFEPTDFARSLYRGVMFVIGVLAWACIFAAILGVGMAIGLALKVLTGDSD